MRALVVIALLAATASAAPKNVKARKEFDRGVAAYTKGSYAEASEAFEKSNAIEVDPETLFAWAQAERKQDHCDKAIELYRWLLAMHLPKQNQEAINVQVQECEALLAAQPSLSTPTEPQPAAPPATEPASQPVTDAQPETSPAAVGVTAPEEGRAWWKDPVGGVFVGAGAVGVGLGIVFLVQGHAADQDKLAAMSYQDFQALDDRAKARGTLGVVSLVVGGALVGTGAYWYATHATHREKTVTGWLDGHGGGLAVSGRF